MLFHACQFSLKWIQPDSQSRLGCFICLKNYMLHEKVLGFHWFFSWYLLENNLFLPTGLLIEQKFVPFFYQMGSLPNGSSVLPEESGTSQGLVIWFICPGWCLYAVVLDKLITNFVLQVSFDWASHKEETWSW